MTSKAIMFAAGAALLGAGALHVYLDRFEREVAGGSPRGVVLVTRDLGLGEVVTEGALSVRELPESYVEERHVLAADLARVIGTRVTNQVHGGSTLLWSDLDLMQDGTTLSGLVRSGMRALSLSESDESFDGLLRPGDRVDVLFSRSEDLDAPTRTLLQNVLVLMVGGDLGGDGRDDSGRVSRGRVTLSVTIDQAKTLAQVEGLGRLRLALRNPDDLVIARGESGDGRAMGAALTEPTHAR